MQTSHSYREQRLHLNEKLHDIYNAALNSEGYSDLFQRRYTMRFTCAFLLRVQRRPN